MSIIYKVEKLEKWTEQFENCYEWDQIPTAVDDGRKVSMDMFTECKSWKTGLKRFEKAFGNINSEVHTWIEGMRESCEYGYFSDTITEGYSWAVEEVREGYWYIYLNISGIYAGR